MEVDAIQYIKKGFFKGMRIPKKLYLNEMVI